MMELRDKIEFFTHPFPEIYVFLIFHPFRAETLGTLHSVRAGLVELCNSHTLFPLALSTLLIKKVEESLCISFYFRPVPR